MTSTDERRFDVLRAIVTDYVNTQEPIGSKALVERHQLGVSSATVRNDMAVLEAEGYIAQPHTSSGRVPTDKGYRLFVDRISEIKPLSQAERRAILSVLDSSVDLDDVLRRSVKLLAELTRHVAVIQYPVLSTATVRHLEVVALTSARLLLVVITDSGRVEQRMVALSRDITDDEVVLLRDAFAGALHGKRLTEASAAVAEVANSAPATSPTWSSRSPRYSSRRWSSGRRTGWYWAGRPTSLGRHRTSRQTWAGWMRYSRHSRSRSWCSNCWRARRAPTG